jgi:hypothetical protein
MSIAARSNNALSRVAKFSKTTLGAASSRALTSDGKSQATLGAAIPFRAKTAARLSRSSVQSSMIKMCSSRSRSSGSALSHPTWKLPVPFRGRSWTRGSRRALHSGPGSCPSCWLSPASCAGVDSADSIDTAFSTWHLLASITYGAAVMRGRRRHREVGRRCRMEAENGLRSFTARGSPTPVIC